MWRRVLLALALAVVLGLGALGCAPQERTVSEETPAPAPSEGEPTDAYDVAEYAIAAADAAAYEPPFSVFRPTWLPEGFEVSDARYAALDATDGSGGLSVTYTNGDASVSVGLAIGDIGEDTATAELPWGTDGMCAVYEDAWDDSYIALPSSPSPYTPNVRTVGVSLEDLERILGSLVRVEP